APKSVTSSTVVQNLNASLLGGVGAAQLARVDTSSTFAVAPSFGATTGAPFAVSSTTKVTNLNADTLDGVDSTSFARTDTTNTFAAAQTFSAQAAFNAAPGTAPFTVASSTKVANLNAETLNGISPALFARNDTTNTF